ncbi:MAG: hypothetical protein QNJ23_10345 [Woeseiaceae bacterium]|nr:hypothetical protein [Woeseiaceae bacterium]
MSTKTNNTLRFLRANWFLPAAAIAILMNSTTVYLDQWSTPKLLEAGLLFDFAVLLPLLYLICYRSEGKRSVIRAIALACLGIWAVGHVVPEGNQSILKDLQVFRYLGLGVLVLLQVNLIVAIFRAVSGTSASAEREATRLADETGTPPWVRKLLAWEAAVWIRAWRFVRKVFRKR